LVVEGREGTVVVAARFLSRNASHGQIRPVLNPGTPENNFNV